MDDPLTPEQIKNWRHVLAATIGPFALVMPDDLIQRFCDMSQAIINITTEHEDDPVKAALLALRTYNYHLRYDRTARDWQVLSRISTHAFALTPQQATRLLQDNPQIKRVESGPWANWYEWQEATK